MLMSGTNESEPLVWVSISPSIEGGGAAGWEAIVGDRLHPLNLPLEMPQKTGGVCGPAELWEEPQRGAEPWAGTCGPRDAPLHLTAPPMLMPRCPPPPPPRLVPTGMLVIWLPRAWVGGGASTGWGRQAHVPAWTLLWGRGGRSNQQGQREWRREARHQRAQAIKILPPCPAGSMGLWGWEASHK